MLITVALTLMSEAILNFLIQDVSLITRLKKIVFKTVRKLPVLGRSNTFVYIIGLNSLIGLL